MNCKALVWKKGVLKQCCYDTKELCRFHKEYKLEWLNKVLFTICKRCNKGFQNNGNLRCYKCNKQSNKPKNNSCQFMTKNNKQCTNQSQNNTEFCRLHIPYVENGVNPDNSNRCDDCGKPHNRNVNKCQDCQKRRTKHQTEKIIEKHKEQQDILSNIIELNPNDNQEQDLQEKEYKPKSYMGRLRRKLLKLKDKSDKQIIEENKKYLNRFNQTDYKHLLIDKCDEEIIKNLDIEMELVESKEQENIWDFIKTYVSSFSGKIAFRQLKYLVKDKTTNKIIGIVSLSSDAFAVKQRDDYIDWTKKDKESKINNQSKINYLMNLTTVVGVQPFAFNCNIGKLLTCLCFSQQVQDDFYKKYNHHIAVICTYGLYGKAIQYERLPYLKYIGLTSGYGASMFPVKLYEEMIEAFKKNGLDKELKKYNIQSSSKMRKLQFMINYLDLETNYLYHGNQRGIYVGFINEEAKQFIQNKKETFNVNQQSIKEITEWWKDRWGLQRYHKLDSENKIRQGLELQTITRKDKVLKNVKKFYEKQQSKQSYRVQQNYDLEYRNRINPSYIAGFLDGDGSIWINKINGCYVLGISFSQTIPFLLDCIQKKYGGNIYVAKKRTNKNHHKYQYTLRITGYECLPLLIDISPCVISKFKQINLAFEFLKFNNKTNFNTQKEELYKQMIFLNKEYKINRIKPYERINWDYIAGIYDAEGCNQTYGYTQIQQSIVQKNDEKLLENILKFMNIKGCVSLNGILSIGKASTKVFIDKILDKLIVKHYQLECTKKLLQLNPKKDKEEILHLINAIKEDKHKDYIP